MTTSLLLSELQLTPDAIDDIEAADTDEDIEWLLAFVRADRLACYCLYQSARPRTLS